MINVFRISQMGKKDMKKWAGVIRYAPSLNISRVYGVYLFQKFAWDWKETFPPILGVEVKTYENLKF